MSVYKGVTIKLAIPAKYAAFRSDFRKKSKQLYPGASVRTRIVSTPGFPSVEEVFSSGNHPLLQGGQWPGGPEGEATIIFSLGETLGCLAIQCDAGKNKISN
jgi:hypothetical protein